MTSRLFINGRFLTQQTTGVQAFARSVCEELAPSVEFTIIVPVNCQLHNPILPERILRTGNRTGHRWEQLNVPSFLKRNTGSILLNLCNTGPAFIKNQVTTIHDLAFLKNSSWFNPVFAFYYSMLIPRLVSNSKSVITVSETVKRELMKSFATGSEKISVTGNKVDSALLSVTPVKPEHSGIHSGKFFLMVGSENPRKNFAFAEKAFINKFPGVALVIAGGSHSAFRSSAKSNRSSQIIRTGYTTNANLRWLYENALGFINPSLYEGFGIPNLEAFAFDCPVYCSGIPAFRETCGDAAFYFDPLNEISFTECLSTGMKNSQLCGQKTLLGKVIFTSFQNKNRTPDLLKALAL